MVKKSSEDIFKNLFSDPLLIFQMLHLGVVTFNCIFSTLTEQVAFGVNMLGEGGPNDKI